MLLLYIFFFISSEERKWRKWADEVFVHVLSPNVYRTLDESYRTFKWFSEVSEPSLLFSFLLTVLKICMALYNDIIETNKSNSTNKI